MLHVFHLYAPYRISLPIPFIERTNVPQQAFVNPHGLFYRFNDRGTEVQGEIRAHIVALDMPTFSSVILVRFFVIYQRLDGNGIQVVIGICRGLVDGAGEKRFGVGGEARGEEE